MSDFFETLMIFSLLSVIDRITTLSHHFVSGKVITAEEEKFGRSADLAVGLTNLVASFWVFNLSHPK